MYIYNVSTKVDFSIEESWKEWMLSDHIPKVMATNCFEKFQFAKLMDDADDDGVVFAISYYIGDLDQFETYIEKYADPLRAETVSKWGDKMIAFRSLMELIK